VIFPFNHEIFIFQFFGEIQKSERAYIVVSHAVFLSWIAEADDQHSLDFTILRTYNEYYMRKFFASLLEVLEVALIAVVAVFVVRTFLVQPFLVSGSSMSPNFSNGDYVLVDEFTYRLRPPVRGEVVVFHDPKDYSTYFIKRVMGLPGERVNVKNNTVTVYNTEHPEGIALNESYLPKGTVTSGNYDYTIAKGTYLLFGDNRPFSFDSRSWGALPASDIVGLVRIRLWPLNELTAFAAPTYQ
jgi:signal peptidase I